ncbi:MAG TPA: 1,4-alpha-glucan branching protein, partial [Firmicutes bacterium]|nr:1,4-alpha-glucan branching protein [Bacillota bacterium]
MHQVKVHAPQELGFTNPVLLFWFPQQEGAVHEVYPSGWDDYGPVFQFTLRRNYFCFSFADRQGEKRVRERFVRCYGQNFGREIWTVARHEEIYPVKPEKPAGSTREVYEEIQGIAGKNLYLPDTDVSGQGAVSLLGVHYLLDGTTLFGFFHPRAARVYVTGNFNDWQSPYHPNPDPEKFLPMKLYRGYNDEPNIWLLRTALPDPADARKNLYKFLVAGGVPLNSDQRP